MSASDAEARLREYGPNTIAHEAGKSVPMRMVRLLRNPLNVLLMTLASLSLVMGNHESAAIIFFMVLLSVSLAFFQERRSSKAAAELRALVHTTAAVLCKADESSPPGRLPLLTAAARFPARK